MGDKSPKAKQRSQNQKAAAKKQAVESARNKQIPRDQPPLDKDKK